MTCNPLHDQITKITQGLRDAEARYGRKPGSVKLLAVSKTRPPDKVKQALAAGLTAFGENYAAELREKVDAIGREAAEWHFIGALQSNKTRIIAHNAHWLHTLERAKIARRLSQQLDDTGRKLNICIQLNLDGETGKSGVDESGIMPLVECVENSASLTLRGLMCIPQPRSTFDAQRRSFARVREIFERLNRQGVHLDTLSMGMSADFEAAIAEGATIVRIGTAVFGPRH